MDTGIAAARDLERWGRAREWRGPDPYDALNASRLPPIARRSPLALRVITQAVKRSPLNLRPLLGIPSGLSAATLAHVISAYARNGFLDPDDAGARLRQCVAALAALRCTTFPEPCWGYHFDVQTRVFFYPRTRPNTIATAFAGLGLLDAYELAGVDAALGPAIGAGDFFIRHVPQTEATPGAYFGYLPGDRTPIHNANMLVAALLARLARVTGREQFAHAARAAVDYTVSRQRSDGAWPYGERPGLSWIDGFHTGYVLDCLLTCIEMEVGGDSAEQAWRHGLGYYVGALIDPDGVPRYSSTSRYPIDGQSVAQALQTLSRAASREPLLAQRRWDVLDFALQGLTRRDGAFVFQRRRYWVNGTAHPRWVQAPMLEALTQVGMQGLEPTATCPSCALSSAHDVLFAARDNLIRAPGSFLVMRCGGCGLAFTWPQLREEEFGRFYPNDSYPAFADSARPRGGTLRTALQSWAARRRTRSIRRGPYARFFDRPPGTLLDVGCGVGHHGSAFRERGWVVHGIEPSESAAREAGRRGLVVHHGTLDDAPAREASFDLVVFNHSLEHIPHPRHALQRASSLLKPGGEIAIAVPDFGCWQRRLFKARWFHLDVPRHLQHFTSTTLADVAVEVGLEDVRVTRYSSLNGLPNSLQYALLGRLVLPQRGPKARLTSLCYRALYVVTRVLPGDHLLLTARRSS